MIIQGGAKSHSIEKKIEYLHYGSRKRADLKKIMIGACPSFLSIRARLEETGGKCCY